MNTLIARFAAARAAFTAVGADPVRADPVRADSVSARPARGPLAAAAVTAAAVALVAAGDSSAAHAIGASLVAGAATGLGAAVLLPMRRLDERRLGVFIALGGGMMLAAAIWSLLLPAWALSGVPMRLDIVVAGMAGWFAMRWLDERLPHRHPSSPVTTAAIDRAGPTQALRLMVVAIAAHNLPEGFAVGAGFGGGDALGWVTALSIAIQNVPEGMIVAAALAGLGASRPAAAVGALASGLVEPVGAALGTVATGISALALPVALALAGGAMLFVVFDELIPQTWRHARTSGSPAAAWAPFAVGFAAVAALVGGIG
ncbi:MAG: ZIP family metal transporter [Lautropia sp.]